MIMVSVICMVIYGIALIYCIASTDNITHTYSYILYAWKVLTEERLVDFVALWKVSKFWQCKHAQKLLFISFSVHAIAKLLSLINFSCCYNIEVTKMAPFICPNSPIYQYQDLAIVWKPIMFILKWALPYFSVVSSGI